MDEGVDGVKIKVDFVESSRRENAGANSTPKTKEDDARSAEVAAGGNDVNSLHGAFRDTGSDIFEGETSAGTTKIEDVTETCG